MEINKYIIKETDTLKNALKKIDLNHKGFILGANEKNQVVGLATDGDIRRYLLKGGNLNNPLKKCMNKNFFYETAGSSRENILKRFDDEISFLPLLNKGKQLVDVISKYDFPISQENTIFSRARSPVRISFGGGGSDLTKYFLSSPGAVINVTISLFSHAILKLRNDKKIFIKSDDLKKNFYAENLEKAISSKDNNFGLILSLIKLINPKHGFELHIYSDYPMSSGLGGSAAVSASILGCFNQFKTDKWTRHELSELAFQAERLYLGIAGGWQDQYATIFGGLNFIEFESKQNIIHPLRIDKEIINELEESLILCDTGKGHDSGEIHEDQRSMLKKKSIKTFISENVELCYQIRNFLLRGNLIKFGQSLDKSWKLKRKFSSKISNDYLDEIYEGSLDNGAIGGKLLGAGGGGFFLFFVPPFKRIEFVRYLTQKNLKIRSFKFDDQGLLSWNVRENFN